MTNLEKRRLLSQITQNSQIIDILMKTGSSMLVCLALSCCSTYDAAVEACCSSKFSQHCYTSEYWTSEVNQRLQELTKFKQKLRFIIYTSIQILSVLNVY